ncbi:MAG: peptide chain release factor N(5)-glutamine methyltransferase [Spirochaetales bacterium]|nr:peptide chain release factor N(5)-glutamine methyltransferase [Spirochaetales bacterium]
MTVGNALQEGQSRLFYAEVDTPLLDATVLLCEALQTTKERLLASLPEPLSAERYRRYRELVDQRSAGIPVSYLRGKKEFYSLEFAVDRRVLVPRPDTEILVEEALRILDAHPGLRRVHDACTGSGCVAIALKHERPYLEVSASDLEPEVQGVFEENLRRLLGGPPVPFALSDLLGSVAGPFDLITANPPYLSDREVDDLLKIGWPEPSQALRGGLDGTDLLARLIAQAPGRLARPGWLLLEAAPWQMERLSALLSGAGFQEVAVAADLGGRARVARARLP